jgi:hypothetical protein
VSVGNRRYPWLGLSMLMSDASRHGRDLALVLSIAQSPTNASRLHHLHHRRQKQNRYDCRAWHIAREPYIYDPSETASLTCPCHSTLCAEMVQTLHAPRSAHLIVDASTGHSGEIVGHFHIQVQNFALLFFTQTCSCQTLFYLPMHHGHTSFERFSLYFIESLDQTRQRACKHNFNIRKFRWSMV